MHSAQAARGTPPALGAAALWERERELGVLEDALGRAAEGLGQVVIVEGPPGVGKSALLAEAARRARLVGMRVAAAGGAELEHGLAFGVARDLFDGCDRGHDSGAPADRFDAGLGLAADGADAVDEPVAARRAFARVVELTQNAPVCVCLDDAHWVDVPSLVVLAYVQQRIAALPVALVIGLDSGERDAAGVLARMLGDPAARVLRPQALSAAAVTQLVRQTGMPNASGTFAEACARATGGNPLLVGQLLGALLSDGATGTQDDVAVVSTIAPEATRRRLAARTARMDAAERALLRAVAVAELPLTQAAALAGLDESRAIAAADRLAAADLIAVGERLAFVHPLVGRCVYAQITPAERLALHRRSARLLRDGGAPPQRIVEQLHRADRLGDPWAGHVLRAAAERALGEGAPARAAASLRRALIEPLSDEQRLQAQLTLGEAALAAGQADALDVLEQAVALARGGPHEAQAGYKLGDALFARGRPLEAGRVFLRGLDAAGAPQQPMTKRLLARLLAVSLVEPALGDQARARAYDCLPAEGQPLAQGDRPVLAALATLAVFSLEPAQHARRLALLALDGGRLVANEAPEAASWTWANAVLVWSDDPESALRHATVVLEDAHARGSVTATATASYCRATANFALGRIEQATGDAERAVQARDAGWEMYLAPACALLCQLRLEAGDVAGAWRALEPVADHLAAAESQFASYALDARARLRLAEGQAAAALEDALMAGALMRTANPAVVAWRSTAALAQTRLGRRAQAGALAGEELELARRFGAPRPIGVALRTLAAASAHAQREGLLRESVAVLETSPARLERVRSLIELGATRRRAGALREARELLDAGVAQAERIGARLLVQRGRDEFEAAGARRPRDRPVTGPQSLTPGERRVAELAAAGLSNREIADRLVVSVKAVQWHLRNVYRKLAVADRRDLTGALADQGSGKP
ncbi:MAG TPA: AAA family ATPase [Solirubrobacteraceae bacterium]|nr:AAA family ATPase [Solirubrobacteraceae bacterium]